MKADISVQLRIWGWAIGGEWNDIAAMCEERPHEADRSQRRKWWDGTIADLNTLVTQFGPSISPVNALALWWWALDYRRFPTKDEIARAVDDLAEMAQALR